MGNRIQPANYGGIGRFYCRRGNRVVPGCPLAGGPGACPLSLECLAGEGAWPSLPESATAVEALSRPVHID